MINYKRFRGEIENYLKGSQGYFESRFDTAFSSLRFGTWLNRTNIKKQEGYHASHLLFILIILPLLRIKTVNSFCKKQWEHWSNSKKDTFYRFKQETKYRWRTFIYKINLEIFKKLQLSKIPQEERYFIIDDTIIQKIGKMIENVSYIFDHNLGRSVLGYCIVVLGLFTANGFYSLDFAYRFGRKKPDKTPEDIGNPRSISGQRSYEAKHYTKLELALMMIENAVNSGIIPGYVMFDSWYAWPVLINGIRKINESIHVICCLKDSKVQYEYKGKRYTLSELYQIVKHHLKKDIRTGLLLKRVIVKLPETDEEAVIVFSKGYKEPEVDDTKGKKNEKETKWAAFLCTNTFLHASTVIKKYIKRWPIEVCFKECKQYLELGKEQSNDFDSQVFATTASFLRYNLLNYMNVSENHMTLGELFEHLADDAAVNTYANKLWDFFKGLFVISFSTLFDLFKIEEDFHSYIDALTEVLSGFAPIQGCET